MTLRGGAALGGPDRQRERDVVWRGKHYCLFSVISQQSATQNGRLPGPVARPADGPEVKEPDSREESSLEGTGLV